jgi:hypothetical protein
MDITDSKIIIIIPPKTNIFSRRFWVVLKCISSDKKMEKQMLRTIRLFWISICFRLNPTRRSCMDCRNGCSSATGNGWHEPREYEWGCPYQENELSNLVYLYEDFKGEVDEEFATICPKYQKLTEEDMNYDSLCD